jgi:hypothetical protein
VPAFASIGLLRHDSFSGRSQSTVPKSLLRKHLGMEPVVGLEPTTDGLQNRCSTTELNWRWHRKRLGHPKEPSRSAAAIIDNKSSKVMQANPGRLPTGDTADYQSALPGIRDANAFFASNRL